MCFAKFGGSLGLVSKSSNMTFEQFKATLQNSSVDRMAEYEIPQSVVYERVGKPNRVQVLDEHIYLYWDIRDGTVQVIGDSRYWEGKFSRPTLGIVSINLY